MKLIKVKKILFFFLMKTIHCDENSKPVENSPSWWKFIMIMNYHHCDENLSVWWKLMILIRVCHCVTISIKNFNCNKDSSFGRKFITMMNIHHNEFIIKFIIRNSLFCFTKSCYIGPLSPAEVETGTEHGKNCCSRMGKNDSIFQQVLL